MRFLAFSPQTRRMTIGVAGAGDKVWVLTKGAPESIRECLDDDERDSANAAEAFDIADAAAARGLRVLCASYRQMTRAEFESWKAATSVD